MYRLYCCFQCINIVHMLAEEILQKKPKKTSQFTLTMLSLASAVNLLLSSLAI